MLLHIAILHHLWILPNPISSPGESQYNPPKRFHTGKITPLIFVAPIWTDLLYLFALIDWLFSYVPHEVILSAVVVKNGHHAPRCVAPCMFRMAACSVEVVVPRLAVRHPWHIPPICPSIPIRASRQTYPQWAHSSAYGIAPIIDGRIAAPLSLMGVEGCRG